MKKLFFPVITLLALFSCQNNSENNPSNEHTHAEHAHEEQSEHQHHDEHNHETPLNAKNKTINFTTEQSKTINFQVKNVKKQTIYDVIRTSGEIESMQGDEQIITAKSSGIVLFNIDKTLNGKAVSIGQNLCTLSGNGLTNDNIKSQFIIAKAKFEKAKTAYSRGLQLVVSKIISDAEFETLQTNLAITKTEYLTLQTDFSDGGKLVKAPFGGFIKNVLVAEGQFVKAGEPLMTVTKNKKLIIRADVSQKYYADLPHIQSANFVTAYDPIVHSIENFNGKLISFAKNIGSTSNYLPVYFEIDNKGKLLPGAFIEVFLKTKPVEGVLAVPLSAIMEDYENKYVYIRTSHENYEKKSVTLGINDGLKVQILSGIKEGDWVVTRGAYQVKMASTSSVIPSHGHSH